MLKLICEAILPFDYEDLGFRETDEEVCFWQNGTKRIIINKKNNRVQFNCITMEVLMVFTRLVKKNLITFSYVSKRIESVTISKQEYEDLLNIKELWSKYDGIK